MTKHNYDFDAIVVGSGMSGSYAAKEFCEKGYKTLVLDRGKPLKHREYETEGIPPWKMPFRGGKLPQDILDSDYPVNQHCYALNEYTQKYFLKDSEHPYIQEKSFHWFRSSSVGGKSLLWARQSYRWCEQDFKANAEDGHGVNWPIRYQDVEPWYDYVEPFIGIAGSKENLPQLPDGKFLPPHPLNVVEREAKAKIEEKYPERKLIPTRVAHLTAPQPIHTELGRGQCQARSECARGCSWGGYYSALSGALPAAQRTGNMTLTANAQVQEVLYDEESGKASGVRYIDTQTNKSHIVSAKVVFMCASTLASIQILLNSKSKKFPNGIGNSSGTLGHYIMDHISGTGGSGRIEGHLESYYKGRRPGGIYVPRFTNLNKQDKNFYRGYGFQGGSGRGSWNGAHNKAGIGNDFKESIKQPGDWYLGLWAFGEMLPRFENHVYLDENKKDQWGMPQLVTSVEMDDNTHKMKADMEKSVKEMLVAAGLKDINVRNSPSIPGEVIHEMGGACMGEDPKTSYLNKWNQNHEVSNLFVTDGAAFSSVSCVNPSITFMALTARAVDYADKQLKAGNL